MRIGPMLVGAAIGGVVWVVAIRATHHAARTMAAPPVPDPVLPTTPDGVVRDSQGNIVGASDSSPLSSSDATTADIAATASSAIDQVSSIVQGDTVAAGIDGTGGAAQPIKTDATTGTIQLDHAAPLGGQGVDQMASGVQRTDPVTEAPPSALPGGEEIANAQYAAYVQAASGTTNGMTAPEIAALLSEGADMGGLAI